VGVVVGGERVRWERHWRENMLMLLEKVASLGDVCFIATCDSRVAVRSGMKKTQQIFS